jgi:hypothetical protein
MIAGQLIIEVPVFFAATARSPEEAVTAETGDCQVATPVLPSLIEGALAIPLDFTVFAQSDHEPASLAPH